MILGNGDPRKKVPLRIVPASSESFLDSPDAFIRALPRSLRLPFAAGLLLLPVRCPSYLSASCHRRL